MDDQLSGELHVTCLQQKGTGTVRLCTLTSGTLKVASRERLKAISIELSSIASIEHSADSDCIFILHCLVPEHRWLACLRRKWRRKFMTFRFQVSSSALADEWVKAVTKQRCVSFSSSTRVQTDEAVAQCTRLPVRRKVLILVNPVSGTGFSAQALERLCSILSVPGSGVEFEVCWTERPGHARDIAGSVDLSFNCLVVIGGDGVAHEVANGLLARTDSAEAVAQIALAIVPTGSGNGLAKNLGIDPFDVDTAALTILHGRTLRIDAMQVSFASGPRSDSKGVGVSPADILVHSLVSVSYGIISDVDRESERYRWMGSFRFTFVAFLQILSLQTVSAHVRVRIHDEQSSAGRIVTLANRLWLCVIATNAPFITHDLKFGTFAQLSDGCLDISMLPLVSRLRLLWVFICAENGSHVRKVGDDAGNSISYYKVQECWIEPLCGTRSGQKQHLLDVDGEFFEPSGPVMLQAKPLAINVMTL